MAFNRFSKQSRLSLIVIVFVSFMLYSFLTSNSIFFLFSHHHSPPVAKTINYTDLPYCQNSETDFIVFKDIGVEGVGLNHKTFDFSFACKIAIETNRILVDYQALLTPRHNTDFDGWIVSSSRHVKGIARWYFSNLVDLERTTLLMNKNEVRKLLRMKDPLKTLGTVFTKSAKTCNILQDLT